MSPMAYAGLAFLLVFFSFMLSYWMLEIRPERQAGEHLDRRMEPVKRVSLTQGVELLRRIKPLSTLPIIQSALGAVATSRSLGQLVEQSGLSITVGGLILSIGFCGLVAFVIFYMLFSSSLLGAAAAVFAGLLPWLLVKRAATKRVRRLEEQFPEAIELIARALRAGHAFTTGMGMVAEQMKDPIKAEFQLLHDRQNFGMPLSEAMRDFAARMPLLDARFFVTAVLTQRESGGNLSEVLDGLAAIIRDRFRLRREVKSLSAHGRITGTVLFSLAPAITLLLFLIAPQHIGLLFTDPIGIYMVVVCLVLQVIGFYAMRRIIDIEIEAVIMLSIALVALFLCVALLSGLAVTQVLGRMAPATRRLRDLSPNAGGTAAGVVLTEVPDPTLERLSRTLPKSPKEMNRLRARLASAGYYDMSTAIYYSAARVVLPVALSVPWLVLLGMGDGWPFALCFAGIGALLPDLWLRRRIRAHAKAITNGLPDVLDLLIVCIEAGSALDQSIAKASEELDLAHPALSRELRLINTEIRAGVPRMEAFQNFSQRTKVEDVETLVTMLVQTDRFGTSVAKALRTHADTSRTKRRQRAEERAKKVGVKLVFPLVFCVFPAVYMVCIGPAVIAIYRAFF